MLVLNVNFWRALMANVTKTTFAAGEHGALANLVMGLFTAPTGVTEDMTIDQLVKPTFAGYAESAVIVWDVPYRGDDGAFQVTGAQHEFRPTDDLVPTTVLGYYLALPGTTELLYGAEVFDTPAQLVTPDDALIVLPSVRIHTDNGGTVTTLP